MSNIAAMVDQLRDELDETTKTGLAASKATPKKTIRKAKSHDLFSPQSIKTIPRIRVIADVSGQVGGEFKSLCRQNGWSQRAVIERFLIEFINRNS